MQLQYEPSYIYEWRIYIGRARNELAYHGAAILYGDINLPKC